MAKKAFKTLVLASSFDEIKRLKPYLDKLQTWAPFDDEQYQHIRLAVNEAVTNAMVHGNKENPDKKVTVRAVRKKNQLQISVEDEGDGYPTGDLPDPTQKENLLDTSGRGLYLIKQYSQNVSFKKKNRQIVMQFTLQDH